MVGKCISNSRLVGTALHYLDVLYTLQLYPYSALQLTKTYLPCNTTRAVVGLTDYALLRLKQTAVSLISSMYQLLDSTALKHRQLNINVQPQYISTTTCYPSGLNETNSPTLMKLSV